MAKMLRQQLLHSTHLIHNYQGLAKLTVHKKVMNIIKFMLQRAQSYLIPILGKRCKSLMPPPDGFFSLPRKHLFHISKRVSK